MGAEMPLRGRVGRHTQSGFRQCQNWADDQEIVIDLLNGIPVMRGGANGSIPRLRIILGIASEALCQAITRFEDRHFPGQRSGFVDPDGAMLNRMLEVLGERPSNRGFQFQKLVDSASPKLFQM